MSDPYLRPASTVTNRVSRTLWGVVYATLFRLSPRPFHSWRNMLLRLFGAQIGSGCHIYPRARIWAPWNLQCEDVVAIADDAIIYNPVLVTLQSHSTISQEAYLCGATHDYNNPDFPMITAAIRIEPYAWICARATVQMGVTVGEGAVLALGGIATKDLDPWGVYAGIPAHRVKTRQNILDLSNHE